MEVAKMALSNDRWVTTRLEAVEALAAHGDLSGLSVLEQLSADKSVFKKASDRWATFASPVARSRGDVSVIAQHVGDHLGPYQTRAGDRIERLEAGIARSQASIARIDVLRRAKAAG